MLDLGFFGQLNFNWNLVVDLMSIVLIDLVLAGDNAVVIAMAVKNLPGQRRTWGIAMGSAGAVLVRVSATFVVAKLLSLPFIKLVGGGLIIWIAVKLLIQAAEENDCKEAGSLFSALWIIIVADMSMGIDNMLAVGAAAHGNLLLIFFGLALSIPFVVCMSSILAKLMDRFTILLYIGAGILGKVGGEMILGDPFVHDFIHPSRVVEYVNMGLFTVGVIILGRILLTRKRCNSLSTLATVSVRSSHEPD